MKSKTTLIIFCCTIIGFFNSQSQEEYFVHVDPASRKTPFIQLTQGIQLLFSRIFTRGTSSLQLTYENFSTTISSSHFYYLFRRLLYTSAGPVHTHYSPGRQAYRQSYCSRLFR